jgi:hypothetical protein
MVVEWSKMMKFELLWPETGYIQSCL